MQPLLICKNSILFPERGNCMKKAYLVLADGTVFQGYGFGAEAIALGELVFSTGMVGYLEGVSDPAYAGQILVQTFPLIGNYGAIEADLEGNCSLRGYIVRECCEAPSNFRCEETLDAFLKKKGVPGICGVDTRAITRHIRDNGSMPAMICGEIPVDLSALAGCAVTGEVAKNTCIEKHLHPAEGEKKFSAAILDYGMRAYLISELQKRGCDVTVYPAGTSAEEILSAKHDGLLLSSGPGDPAENTACIAEIAKLLGRLPIFGVGLGHQMAAIAAGAQTAKMKHGHRGANQPVRAMNGGRTYITSQNHGYEVLSGSVQQGEICFVNANDGGCEGISYPRWNALTVQFYPDSHSCSMDTSFLFDRFIEMMGGENACR